jgi:hypothetical protein
MPAQSRGRGGLLAGTFRLWLRNLPKLALVSALVWLPFYLLQFGLGALLGAPHHTGAALGLIYVVFVVVGQFLVGVLTQAALTRAAADLATGEPVEPRRAYSAAGSRFLAVLAANLVVVALLLVAFVGVLLVGTLLAAAAGPLIFLLSFLLGLLLMLLLFARFFAVAVPAVVIDGLSGVQGVSRSSALLSSHFLSSLVLLLVLGVVGFFATVLLSIPAQAAAKAGDIAVLALQGLGALAGSVVLGGLVQTGLTLLYLEVREGG